jgi:hypothetical protein
MKNITTAQNFLFLLLLLTTNAVSAQEYDWTTDERGGQTIHDGIQYNNHRWNEDGSIFVKFGPPAATWWTTHNGNDPSYPVSAPLASIGRNRGIQISAPEILPARIQDIEYLRVSMIATLPKGSHNMYRVYWQSYLSDSPDGSYSGDFSPTIYWQNCPDNWWGTSKGHQNIDETIWDYIDCGYSKPGWRYCSPMLVPKLTPDEQGKIEMFDVDFKPLLDKAVEMGFYRPEQYLLNIQPSIEVWVMDETFKMNDMSFVVKVKNQQELIVPSWTTLVSKNAHRPDLLPDQR